MFRLTAAHHLIKLNPCKIRLLQATNFASFSDKRLSQDPARLS